MGISTVKYLLLLVAISVAGISPTYSYAPREYVTVPTHYYAVTTNDSGSKVVIAVTTAPLAFIVLMSGPSHLVIESKIEELVREGLIKAYVIDYRDYVKRGLTLLTNPKTGKVNPHGYLFTYSGLLAAASSLTEVLKEVDPLHRDYYESRLQCLKDILLTTKESVKEIIQGSIKVAILTPVLQYVVNDLGLKCTEIILQDPETELTEMTIDKLVKDYKEGLYDALLIADFVAVKYPRILDVLKSNKIPYVIVPVNSLATSPYLIPVAVATSLREITGVTGSVLGSSRECGGSTHVISELPTALAISEAVLVAVLATVVILQRRFIESKVVRGE